jgi:hypothetical protein
VSTVREFSWKLSVAAPVPVSSVPVTGTENVFSTHTDSPEFTIGSGVPNRHPVSVQSIPAGGTPAATALTVHADPTHASPNRFVAPAGVALSGTCDSPPPSDRFPQSRFLSGVTPPTSRNVCPHVPAPTVEMKSKPDGPVPVVLVVDVDVVGVVVLDVDVLELELVEVDEEVEDDVLDDEVLVEVEVEVLVVVVDDVLVLLDVELLVEDVLVLVVLDVDVLVVLVVDVLVVVVDDVEVELVDVLVEDDVEVEVVAVDEVLVDVVLVVLVLVVVVVWFGLQTIGSGLTKPGTATASMQSVLKTVTQSTQSTTSWASRMAPPQLDASNVVTEGQFPTKPIWAGVTSGAPPQSLSLPPHALQMVEIFLVSALEMRSVAFPSPGSGHGFACSPFRRASQHFWSALERAPRNLDVALPIACWHLLTALLVPNSACESAA